MPEIELPTPDPEKDEWGTQLNAAVVAVNQEVDRVAQEVDSGRLSEASQLASYAGRAPALAAANSISVPRTRRTLITSFQSGHGWTAYTGTAGYSIADDATDYILGSQSRKITLPATSSASASDRKLGLPAVDLTGKELAILCKVDRPDLLSQINLYVGHGNMANYYTLNAVTGNSAANATAVLANEWQWINFTFGSQIQTGGTPSKTAITDYQISVQAPSAMGAPLNVHIGAIAYYTPPTAYPNGVLSFTFDDSYGSQFTNAMPVLDKYGYPGTVYNIVEKVGAVGGLTLSQLGQMQDLHGWDVGGHAYTLANHNTGFVSISDEALESEMVNQRDWLRINGFRGAGHFAYPGGQHDARVLAATRRYFSTARGVNALPRQSVQPDSLGLRLRSYPLNNTTTTASITGLIDNAYANGWWLILYGHDIVSGSASTSAQFAKANLQTITDYAATKGIPVRTVGEVMRGV